MLRRVLVGRPEGLAEWVGSEAQHQVYEELLTDLVLALGNVPEQIRKELSAELVEFWTARAQFRVDSAMRTDQLQLLIDDQLYATISALSIPIGYPLPSVPLEGLENELPSA